MKEKIYRINEIFYSLQGEGTYTGTPAVFVRFAGCNLNCPFCDTDFSRYEEMSADAIVEKCLSVAPVESRRLLVLTGGEPTLQVDANLVARLHNRFYHIAIETNGTKEVPYNIDFITCSPKSDFAAARLVLKAVDEVKVVFDGEHDVKHWLYDLAAPVGCYFLQPCDTGDAQKNKEIQAQTVEYIKNNPEWRLSLQTQKILSIR